MKIINQTSSQIFISAPKNYSLPVDFIATVLVVGSGFIFVPMLMMSFQFEILSRTGVLRVNCDRVEPQQVNCQISKSKYLDFVQQEPLKYKFVNSAKYNVIDKGKDSDGDQVYRYNFSLLTKFGEKVPFESIKSSTANSIASALNPFLQSKQESFRYTLDERSEPSLYISMIFLIPFFAAGFSSVWFAFSALAYSEEIILDKSKYQLRHSKRTLLGTKVNSFRFNEVAKVDVLYATDSYKNIYFTPRITVDSNRQFSLDTIKDRQIAIKIANDLNRFMGLPEEEDPVVKE
ncbi:hypothetical protein HCU40_04695 [Pseudanabaena biceps]|nr:hypothetical protein [Pseudanabaena biceps]